MHVDRIRLDIFPYFRAHYFPLRNFDNVADQ